MSRTDADIVAVRDLPPGLPEPSDEAVSRTWHAVVRRGAARGRSRRLRVLVPVAAAAAVAAVLGGAAVVLRPDSGPAPTTVEPTPSDTSTAMDVAVAFDRLIARAGQQPATPVAPGQLIYNRSAGSSAKPVHETWVDPEGMIALGIRQDGDDLPPEVEDQRRFLAEHGPSLEFPTPSWLAALPRQPDALRAALIADMQRSEWSVDFDLWEGITTLCSTGAPMIPPDLRVGLYDVLAGLTGLAAFDETVEGRRVYAVRRTEFPRMSGMLFDPDTGAVVGSRGGTPPG